MQGLQVSLNRRFLVYAETKTPFFWLADTAWEIFHRCTLEDATLYLENRRQKGFNIIFGVALAEFDGLEAPNAYGHCPFHDLDPAKPNEPYWQHVDAVIQTAQDKGLYIGLLPTWGDKVNLQWGKGPVIFNADNARAYGAWLGTRYREYTHIIWILGGDRDEETDGVDYAPVWRAMAAGIRSATKDGLMTYHPRGYRGSSMTFHDDDWLDLNMWQSCHVERDNITWEYITQDYQRTPTKPVLDGEPNYEDHPVNVFAGKWQPEIDGYFDDYDVRKQAYRAVFAGACGHTYGHHSIWQFWTAEREPVNKPVMAWQAALDRPGAVQMGILRRLMESFSAEQYLNRIPDQHLIASDIGERGTHIRATRDTDGTYALVYIPTLTSGHEVLINTQSLKSGQLQAVWFDPRTGAEIAIGDYPSGGVLAFTTPTLAITNSDDWVLWLRHR